MDSVDFTTEQHPHPSSNSIGDQQATAGLMDRPLAILVLGMHRSGTSALTRIVAMAGAELPRVMIETTQGNRTGHWESRSLVLTNDRILEALGLSWFDWRSPNWSALSVRERAMIEMDLIEVIDKDFGGEDAIVVKDPRMCRLVPHYLSVFKAMNYSVVPVLAFRNPQEVIRSLAARSNWPEGRSDLDAALLWLVYTLESERATRHLGRVIVSFSRMLSSWPSILSEIESCSQAPLPNSAESIKDSVSEFLNPDERHHFSYDDDLARDPITMGWIRNVYEAMRLLEADPASTVATARLDKVRQQLDTAFPVLEAVNRERGKALHAQHQANDIANSAKNELVLVRREAEEQLGAARLELAEAERRVGEVARAAESELVTVRREAEEQLGTARLELAEAERRADDVARAAESELVTVRREAEEQLGVARLELAEAERRADEVARAAESELVTVRREAEEQLGAVRLELAEVERRADEVARAAVSEVKADLQRGFEQERAALSRQLSSALSASELAAQQLLEAQGQAYRSSTSWRITVPLRSIGGAMRSFRKNANGLKSTVAMLGGLRPTLLIAARIVRNQGVRGFASRLHQLRAQGYVLSASDPTSTGDYVNLMAAERRSVLLSDWHIALTRAIWDDRPAEQDGATLGLSIVTYNSARWLPGFLNSLLNQGFPLSRLNVAVVDHESSDNTIDLLQAHISEFGSRFASFTLHRRPNLGFGAGHDYAIRELSDEFILITNVDLNFNHDSLIRAQRAAMADRKDVAAWELRQCPYEHPKYYDPVTLDAVWNSHACVLFRRHAYLEVGGYDNRIFMYGEDVELSYRFRGRGWRLRYLPQISVTHFVDLDDTTLRPTQLSGSLAANVLLRYRYGGDAAGAEGEALLSRVLADERDPTRRVAMIDAQARIFEDREHFRMNLKPSHTADFPFSGFDYIIARDGARVAIDGDNVPGNIPKVSVVTRTHGPKTEILREALAAVINQSYKNIEHLVVEDRTDFARELVERVAGAYSRELRYLKSDGEGRSAAGNHGLSHAQGELLMLLDNDDLLFCDHVEILQRKLMTAPDLVAAYALGWDVRTRFDETGSYREVEHFLPPGHRFTYDRERLQDMNFIPIQAILFRRDVFEAEGGFDIEVDHLEDWNLWSRYSNYGDFEMIPKLTSMYRTPADQKIRDMRQADLDAAYIRVKALNAKRRQEFS